MMRWLGFTPAFWLATATWVLMSAVSWSFIPDDLKAVLVGYGAIGIGVIGTIDLHRGSGGPTERNP